LIGTLGGHADDLLAAVRLMGNDLQERAAQEYAGQVLSCAYSPDGEWLASGTKEGLYLWEASAGRPQSLTGHSGDVNACAFSPDGRWLASGSDDGTVRVWDMRTSRESACLSVDPGLRDSLQSSKNNTSTQDYSVSSCTFSPDGKRLLALITCRYTEWAGGGGPLGSSSRLERVARIWATPRWSEVATVEVGSELSLQSSWVGEKGCAYSADGRHIVLGRASLSTDGASRIAIGGGCGASLWSPDLTAPLAAFGDEADGEIGIRRVPGGEGLAKFVTRGYNVVLAQDPTGINLAVGDNAGRIYLLALQGMEPVTPFITATRLFCIATREWDRARCHCSLCVVRQSLHASPASPRQGSQSVCGIRTGARAVTVFATAR